MRRLWIAGTVVAVLLGVAAPSHAATVVTSEHWEKYGLRGHVTVTAKPGEVNAILVERGPEGVRITDAVPPEAGYGCALQPDASVVCTRADSVTVDAGDLDDRVTVRRFTHPVGLIGGDGDDVLTTTGTAVGFASFVGGRGDDRMISGPDSHDFFSEGALPNGSDTMEGGLGDRISYSDRMAPVHVDLRGDENGGERGERDRIGPGISDAEGGAGADTLIGTGAPNRLIGGGGADLLRGGGGPDDLHGDGDLVAVRGPAADRLFGGPGADSLFGGGGGDLLNAGPGEDSLNGGAGRDRLLPGRGGQLTRGGPGNDVVLARHNGNSDEIDCGGGWDRVRNDPLDSLVFRTCERHGRAERLTAALPF
jgi:Ca2+-binding RTX toxin-like protein